MQLALCLIGWIDCFTIITIKLFSKISCGLCQSFIFVNKLPADYLFMTTRGSSISYEREWRTKASQKFLLECFHLDILERL